MIWVMPANPMLRAFPASPLCGVLGLSVPPQWKRWIMNGQSMIPVCSLFLGSFPCQLAHRQVERECAIEVCPFQSWRENWLKGKEVTKNTNGSMRKLKWKFKDALRQMTLKVQPYKIYGMQQKQFSEGNSEWCRPSSKKNKKQQQQQKTQEKSQVNNLSCHLNKPEKEGTKPKLSRRKEIIEIREEIEIFKKEVRAMALWELRTGPE